MRAASLVCFYACLSFLSACDAPMHLAPDATLPDGSTYQGDIKDGLFHGRGTWKLKEGGFYRGEFKDGLMHGEGRFEDQFGDVYEGQFSNGVATGEFTVTSKDPVYQYQGSLVAWRFEGQGTYQNEEERYVGEFDNGLYHGQGSVTYAAEGSGSYTGQFEKGSYNGKGVYELGEQRWDGTFVAGVFQGPGTHTDAEGNIHSGEFVDWVLNGEGSITSPDGKVKKGTFSYGYLSGEGSITEANGEVYSGTFNYDSLEGKGRHLVPDVSEYEGEFSFSSYSGTGRLQKFKNGEVVETVEGQWRNGRFLGAGENPKTQGEIALTNHERLLKQSLATIKSSNAGEANVYFLGVAGDGSQSVFKREVMFVRDALRKRYPLQDRELLLINHHTSAAEFPMATRASIDAALTGIAEKMDADNDVLIVYLTSHGSEDHQLSLKSNDIKLSSISAEELGAALKATNIRWKAIFVSACYAGGFIPALKDDTSMIITAADDKSTSFGCDEESDGTYFGKAFFLEGLKNNPNKSLIEIFASAKVTIGEWESEQDLEPSNPQIYSNEAIEVKLGQLD